MVKPCLCFGAISIKILCIFALQMKNSFERMVSLWNKSEDLHLVSDLFSVWPHLVSVSVTYGSFRIWSEIMAVEPFY